jgi:hypothetical protein
MALSGTAKADYQREYMRRKRYARASQPVCSFCGEHGTAERLLVGDADAVICEQCVALAVVRIAEARRSGASFPEG